jgi:hypothetical protein
MELHQLPYVRMLIQFCESCPRIGLFVAPDSPSRVPHPFPTGRDSELPAGVGHPAVEVAPNTAQIHPTYGTELQLLALGSTNTNCSVIGVARDKSLPFDLQIRGLRSRRSRDG